MAQQHRQALLKAIIDRHYRMDQYEAKIILALEIDADSSLDFTEIDLSGYGSSFQFNLVLKDSFVYREQN